MKTTGAPITDDAEWMCGKPAKTARYCLDTDLLMDILGYLLGYQPLVRRDVISKRRLRNEVAMV